MPVGSALKANFIVAGLDASRNYRPKFAHPPGQICQYGCWFEAASQLI